MVVVVFGFNRKFSWEMSVIIRCFVYFDVKANEFMLSEWQFPKSLISESLVPIPHQTEPGAPNETKGSRLKTLQRKLFIIQSRMKLCKSLSQSTVEDEINNFKNK